LKRRGLAYEHPTDKVWTLDQDEWMQWASNHIDHNPTATVLDTIRDYPIEYDEFDHAVTP